MTHMQFAILLGVYLVLILIIPKTSSFSKQKDHATKYLATKSKQFLVTYTIINLIMLLIFIAGIIGMFFLWWASPILFFAGIAAKNLDSLVIPPRSHSGLNIFISEIENIFEGALFVVVFFGPARHLFYQT